MQRVEGTGWRGRRERLGRRGTWLSVFCLLGLLGVLPAQEAFAGGPRFVAGVGIWVNSGTPENWNTTQLLYFTDPGDLQTSVSHAQADAMVAAAAAVWNVPTSSLSLTQGGTLAEDVSTANSYFNGTTMVFPADVTAANETAMPVAVLYDKDGSLTDLLLGSGASAPVACRQHAVTESVDDIGPDGYLHHAIVILNGRCVGGAPEQLTQMQYQLARAFGRVLGVAWSQNNDNVFTAATTVTADEEAYWPLMHPIDVICGTYTYQCMANPFSLRPDDLNALALLYPVKPYNLSAGKQLSSTDAVEAWGWMTFPTGQGMDWVNVTTHRIHAGAMEPWETVSSTTGFGYQQALSNPVTGLQAVNEGSYFAQQEGYFYMPAVPVDTISNVFFTSEPINPLYTGAYALAPYVRPPVTPSGSAQTSVDWSATGGQYGTYFTPADAASSCAPGNDGSEAAPATFDASGWQTGLLCAWGHSSWWTATVRAGRSWTLEVTATDETGTATTEKAQPIMGIWRASDGTGTLPTLAAQEVPFNSIVLGMTQARMAASAVNTPLRVAVSDQFGAGRPDFSYTARLLYADAVSPTSLGTAGGLFTIRGMGFRQGAVVRVNGVAATIHSVTATQIVAVAPSLALVGATLGRAVTVAVNDPVSNGSTTITRAITYTQSAASADLLQLVSAPVRLETGIGSAVPFAVRVLASDGVTPVVGGTVQFAVSAGQAGFSGCPAAAVCNAVSDAQGLAQVRITGLAAGNLTFGATEMSGGATVQVTLPDVDPVRTLALSETARYVAAGASGTWTLGIGAVQDGVAASGAPVTWTASNGLTLGVQAGETAANGTATAMVSVEGIAAGSVGTVTGCVWRTICGTWTVYGVDAALWRIGVTSGAGQSVPTDLSLKPVGLLVTDVAGHVLEGAPVQVYQRVLAPEGVCSTPGRCPAEEVLNSSQSSGSSDMSGMLTVVPLQVPGTPQTVEIALASGTQGFVTLTLVKTATAP